MYINNNSTNKINIDQLTEENLNQSINDYKKLYELYEKEISFKMDILWNNFLKIDKKI